MAVGHMEVRPDWYNKTQFLTVIGHVNTAIWMRYIDANWS